MPRPVSRVGRRHTEQRLAETFAEIQEDHMPTPRPGTVDAFLERVREAGWKTETRPMPAVTPRHGDIVTTYGDPTAYHVWLLGKNTARLVADEGDIDVWVNTDAITVAARRINGRWCDTRAQQGPAII